MADLDAQHLVVGGGILALLVAERLLGRGARGVVVLTGSGLASEPAVSAFLAQSPLQSP